MNPNPFLANCSSIIDSTLRIDERFVDPLDLLEKQKNRNTERLLV